MKHLRLAQRAPLQITKVLLYLTSFFLLIIGCKSEEPVGFIEVKSTPSGAQVFLDGSATGETTYCVLENVKEGEHTVKLTKSGYTDWDTIVIVLQHQVSTINGR